jgi:fucose permease
MATKTSILLFYLNLTQTEKIFRWATWGTLAIVNLAGLALTLLNTFQCRPISAAFLTPVPQQDHCEYIVTLYLSSAPVNIITDLAIMFLPMPLLTAMRLPRKQKIILIITFGFGFFVAVVDVIRIAYLQEAATARLSGLASNSQNDSGSDSRNNTDVPWYASLSYMWSAVEVNVGIMCACVPGLKPLVARFMPHILRDLHDRQLSVTRDSEKVDSMDMNAAHRVPSLNRSSPTKQQIETHGGSESEEPLDMIDFLTTPDMNEFPIHRTQTALTNTTRHTSPPTFFDFVNIKKSKSMVQMTVRESLFPNIMVTILFLVWGIAYGFLDALNMQFQRIAKMTAAQTVGIHSAYFAAYLVGTLTFGRLILKHWGFKACYIVGLFIYACGVLIFWPSAVLTSFPAFLVSNFIVGLGLSTLEIAANPFVALCGPPQYMEMRLNLSQGVQAIGSVVSPLLASKVLFKSTSAGTLIDVQWTYLGIALFTVGLAVAYYYVPLPEATDKELEESAEREDFAHLAEIHGVRVIWITLGLGILAQFAYVGAQESIATSFSSYVKQVFRSKHLSSASWTAVGHTCFALSRFLVAILGFFIKPRYLLLFFFTGAIVLSAMAQYGKGRQPQVVLMLLFFFEGPLFSLIFATCLRGLGRHTKNGSALMTGAISGGAAWPPIMFAVAKGPTPRRLYQHAYSVVVAAMAVGILLPLWQNIMPQARKIADPVKRSTVEDNELHQTSISAIRNWRHRKNDAEHVERASRS